MANDALGKLNRLPQADEAWEATARRMRAWITPHDQPAYRPYVIVAVSQTGSVVGSEIVENVPSPEQVLDVLAKAMRRPILGGGRKRRPATVYVDDQALAETLAPQLQEIGIRCEYQQLLRHVEHALLSMEQFMTRQDPIPGLLKLAGVTPYLVNGLFEAAASFYRQAPWRWIDDSRPIEVRYPPEGRRRYAVVMGHGGQTYGLAVYNSPDDLRQVYSGAPAGRLIGQMQWTSLLFGEAMEMPFDDLDAMDRYGWPVAGEQAYPIPLRVTRAGQPVRPAKSELLWFEAALLAVPVFVRALTVRDHLHADQAHLRPAAATLTVAMADGESAIHLRYPVPGFEIPYEAQWPAAESEMQAPESAAQQRNAELLHTFEQWLVRQNLTQKTVQRHLDNVTFFAQGYMAGESGSTESARPADQAGAADVDEFLSEWFLHNAWWPSVGTLKANLASLKKFYSCLKETGHMEAASADEILKLLQVDREYYVLVAQEYEQDNF